MPQMPPLVNARIDVDATGRGAIEIDGNDVADQVRAFKIEAGGGQVAALVIELNPGHTQLVIDGELTVVAAAGASNVVAFLESIDQEKLNEAVLSRASLATDVMEDVLDVLKEMASAGDASTAGPST